MSALYFGAWLILYSVEGGACMEGEVGVEMGKGEGGGGRGRGVEMGRAGEGAGQFET